jgi:hypothetical protein
MIEKAELQENFEWAGRWIDVCSAINDAIAKKAKKLYNN